MTPHPDRAVRPFLARTASLLAGLVVAVSAAITGCSAPPARFDLPTERPPQSPTPRVLLDDPGAELFAERDAFLRAQGGLGAEAPLTATTPEQRDFVAAQRAHIEAQGAAWNPDIEAVALGAALDACETSILSGHEIDVDVFAGHVASSPLFAAYAPEPSQEAGLAGIMVFGTGFLCPADEPQWRAAFEAVYGG